VLASARSARFVIELKLHSTSYTSIYVRLLLDDDSFTSDTYRSEVERGRTR
jgi:hypothetical protein